MQSRTKMLINLALLSAIAYVVMVYGRVPVVLFLKYEPKDVIITIGGFIYGPLAAFFMALVVAFLEMVSVSDTGLIGFAMNLLATSAFACTAAFIYKKKPTLSRAVTGLIGGGVFATAVMLLWNYLLTPIYMGYPREAVVALMLPAFLPFNLLKVGLNGALTMLIYKPLVNALRRAGLIPPSTAVVQERKKRVGPVLVSSAILITCLLLALAFKGVI
jgi:riboflavin transporter FmnP